MGGTKAGTQGATRGPGISQRLGITRRWSRRGQCRYAYAPPLQPPKNPLPHPPPGSTLSQSKGGCFYFNWEGPTPIRLSLTGFRDGSKWRTCQGDPTSARLTHGGSDEVFKRLAPRGLSLRGEEQTPHQPGTQRGLPGTPGACAAEGSSAIPPGLRGRAEAAEKVPRGCYGATGPGNGSRTPTPFPMGHMQYPTPPPPAGL
ncbi:hypothetical protein GWK47_044001 [Chionoecetes opilio]|uniref:Uncharacterized protein n=1 Tax=Chionoecetes opilio TaxID=41210 RepID=A0A8J4YJQ0_CHIOP|nr:hypothetical protein GWK47_044001 [Chionoecetes opilio]